LVANGKNKADIICAMATGPVTPQVPASVLQLHGDVTIFADKDALSVLMEKAPQLISGLK
jgi:glucosamine-6-phosphate deaminase